VMKITNPLSHCGDFPIQAPRRLSVVNARLRVSVPACDLHIQLA